MSKANKPLHRLEADLLSLRVLVAVAEERNFSRAAKRVGRSQSAVSLQIAKLEETLQVRLLDRTSRSVTPTAAGEILIAYANRMLDLADEAVLALAAPDADEPLKVGMAEYLVPLHLHEVLARFRRAHPKSSLQLRLGNGADLVEEFSAGDLHLVIAGPEGPGGATLRREPLVWVGSADRELVTSEPVPLVLMQPPCTYRRAAFDALAGEERPWTISIEANAIEGVRSAVAAGLGVSVMARSAVTRKLKLLENLPKLPMTAIVVYGGSKNAHPLASRLMAFLEEELFPEDGVLPPAGHGKSILPPPPSRSPNRETPANPEVVSQGFEERVS